jgi:hypothetical protein
MAVHAFFSAVQGTTQRKTGTNWVTAQVNDPLKGGDKSQNNPPDQAGKNYKVNLCSSSQVTFYSGGTFGNRPFTLSNASGQVFVYDATTKTWSEIDTDALPAAFNHQSVKTDSDSSVNIDVTNGARGIYGPPPQW